MDSKQRRKILEKRKAAHELLNIASALVDPLSAFASLRRYSRNGLSVYFESGRGNKLSSPVKQYIQKLLRANMKGFYGSEWPIQEKVKRREMVSHDACYILVHEVQNKSVNNTSIGRCVDGHDLMAGFVQYRFTLEEEIPVLYVYEIQLESRVQGKGLGEFLMQLVELIASKNQMGALVLTVQKSNSLAMNFYMTKTGAVANYEILCKTFDSEAKSILETDEEAAANVWHDPDQRE